MIGHNQIIEARKRGFKPAAILINAGFDPMPARFDFERPERALAWNLYPTVTIPLRDLGKRHDMRFLAGCIVLVNGHGWSDELMTFLDNLAESAPNVAIVTCVDENNDLMEYRNGEWIAYAN